MVRQVMIQAMLVVELELELEQAMEQVVELALELEQARQLIAWRLGHWAPQTSFAVVSP